MTSFRQQPLQERDPELLARIQAGDSEALRELLVQHGPRMKYCLQREFRKLSEEEIDEALNTAAHAAWTKAGSFDPSRGTARAWFYVIGRHAALDIVRRKRRDQRAIAEIDLDAASLCAAAAPGASPEPAPPEQRPAFLDDLRHCIAGLPRLQRGIIEADLRAGDVASAAELAKSFRTSKNSIYVSRSIARKSLRLCLTGRGHAFSGP